MKTIHTKLTSLFMAIVLLLSIASVSVVSAYVAADVSTNASTTSVQLNKTKTTIYYKAKTTLKVLNTTSKVTWSTTDDDVATVTSNGTVKGVGLGTCYIKAKVGTKTYKCKVTVEDRNVKAKVTFKTDGGGYFIKGESKAKITVKPYDYNCAKATVYVKNAANDTVYKKTLKNLTKDKSYSFTWRGKNSNGYVYAGSYKITVKIGDKKSHSDYLSFKTKNDFADGNGSKSNPFIVSSASQLKKIVKYPNAYFKQSKNIDLNYTAVGGFFSADQPFTGNYNGNGKKISNIVANEALFEVVGEKGIIKNVKMENCSVIGNNQALLVKDNYGKIQNCNLNGNVTANDDWDTVEIGFVALDNYGVISNCETSGKISATQTYGGNAYASGIADLNTESGIIISCVSHVDAFADGSRDGYACGITSANYGMVTGCEADGKITASDYEGGIAGTNYAQILDSYYTGESTVSIAGKNLGTIA